MNIAGVDTSASESKTTIAKSNILGKDDFLHLLVAQLKNQDPLEPLDSTAFTAQLAQFSSLEQLTLINESMEGLNAPLASLNNAKAVDFIGKTVKASGNSISLTDGVADEITFELAANSKAVQINIYDGLGNYVKTIEISALNAGANNIKWDGTNQNGGNAANGAYTFEILAVDADDAMVKTSSFITSKVTGVTFKNGFAYLLAGNNEIPVGSVIDVIE